VYYGKTDIIIPVVVEEVNGAVQQTQVTEATAVVAEEDLLVVLE
jgi:hypothetical protein